MGKRSRRPDLKRRTLERIVSLAKAHRNSEGEQHALCEASFDNAQRCPSIFRYNNLDSEVPLCILLALRVHPNSTDLRHAACFALCALLGTSCVESLFKYGGARALTSILQQDVEDESIQFRILEAVGELEASSDNRSSIPYFEALKNAGLHTQVLKSLKVHDKNVSIQGRGAMVLRGLLWLGVDDELLVETVDVLVAILCLSKKTSSGFDTKLFVFCCSVIELTLDEYPNAISAFIAHQGAPLMICEAMKICPNNICMQSAVLHVLLHLVNDYDVREECYPFVLWALKNNHHDKTVRLPAIGFMLRKVFSASDSTVDLHIMPFCLRSMEIYNEWEDQYFGCSFLASLLQTPRTRNCSLSLAGDVAKALFNALKFTHCQPNLTLAKVVTVYETALEALALLLDGQHNISTVYSVMKEQGAMEAMTMAMQRDLETSRWTIYGHKEYRYVAILHCILAGVLRDDVKMDIAIHGGVKVVLTAMKKNPDYESLQDISCILLGMLTTCKHPIIFEPIAKADGVNIILDAIEKFPKNKNIFNYGGSAAILTREYEDEKKYGKLEL